MIVDAPLVARKAQPGQFIIFRATEDGERIPLTIADYDREKGTVTIIFVTVGFRAFFSRILYTFFTPYSTVSYTHLDVYKRQPKGGACAFRMWYTVKYDALCRCIRRRPVHLSLIHISWWRPAGITAGAIMCASTTAAITRCTRTARSFPSLPGRPWRRGSL